MPYRSPSSGPLPSPATRPCRPLRRPRRIGHLCKRLFVGILLVCKTPAPKPPSTAMSEKRQKPPRPAA
jgi:hypothetical protein